MSAEVKLDGMKIEELRQLLSSAGLRVGLREFTEMVRAAMDRLPGGREATGAPDGLESTYPEAQTLQRGGFTLEFREEAGGYDPVARTAARYTALLGDSMTTTEAAEMLGVNPSRIRQRLLARPRTLYGIHLRSGWRLPRFQFEEEEGRLVHGMDEVIAALDPDLHPVAVVTWLETPNPDLSTELDGTDRDAKESGVPVLLSPLQWLRSGRSASLVAKLAALL